MESHVVQKLLTKERRHKGTVVEKTLSFGLKIITLDIQPCSVVKCSARNSNSGNFNSFKRFSVHCTDLKF
jgi:hypothetical protein